MKVACESSIDIAKSLFGDLPSKPFLIACGMIADHPGNHRQWRHGEEHLHIEWGREMPKTEQATRVRRNPRLGFDTPDSETNAARVDAWEEHQRTHR